MVRMYAYGKLESQFVAYDIRAVFRCRDVVIQPDMRCVWPQGSLYRKCVIYAPAFI